MTGVSERLPASRTEAIELGTVRYDTGQPCQHGHLSPRATLDGYCIACRNAGVKRRKAEIMAKRKAAGK